MAKPWHRWPPPLRSPDGPLRLRIYARYGNRCAVGLPGCKVKPTHLDHIVPPPEGGAWFDEHNLRPACAWCNSKRSNPKARARAAEHRPPSQEW